MTHHLSISSQNILRLNISFQHLVLFHRNENLDQNKFHLGVRLSGMISLTGYDIAHIARNRPFCQLQWEVKSNWSITNCALLMFLTPSFMKCYQTCQEMDILQVITSGPPKKQMSQFCRDPRRTPSVVVSGFQQVDHAMYGH